MEISKDSLKVGDDVTVTQQGQHNGSTGRVVGLSAKGGCIVMLKGSKKAIAVQKDHVEIYKDPPPEVRPVRESYSIVGTWDDWMEHTMEWNGQTQSYEYFLSLASQDDSFKILEGGDWTKCVHPTKPDTHFKDDNSICGPDDDSSLSQVWTIGSRQEDNAFPGAKFLIRFFVSSHGRPSKVRWDNLDQQQKGTPKEESPSRKTNNSGKQTARFAFDSVDAPAQKAYDSWEQEDPVVLKERAARERLAKRFMEAAQAIGDKDKAPDDHEMIELRSKVEENRRRYQAHTPARTYSRKNVARQATAQLLQPAAPVLQGACIECGTTTGNILDVGNWCCAPCWKEFQNLTKDGWDSTLMIQGQTAAWHLDMLREKNAALTLNLARREIMAQFAEYFSKAKSNDPAETT